MTASRGLMILSLLFIAVSAFPSVYRLVGEDGPPPLSATYVGGFVGLLGLTLSFVIGGLEARIATLEKERSETQGSRVRAADAAQNPGG